MSSYVLFENDLLDYPKCILDTQTSNRSSLELSAKLRSMGVKNNAFFLVLLDPSLQGVDPHAKDLDKLTMTKIGLEVIRNPWYYFREIAKAPASSGTKADPVIFNRSNVSMWWCFFNHITYILTQPRQTGKSFNCDLLMTGLQNFWTQNTQINLLTATDKLRAENIERLKKIYDTLPDHLNFKDRTDSNNTELLTVNAFKNRYLTHVAQSSEKAAHKLGRGLTTPIMEVDEAPFISHIETAINAAFGAMGAAIDAAKRNNSPYGIIWTTTAGNQDDRDGKFVYDYVCGAALWNERFYDAQNEADLRRMVTMHAPCGDYRVYGAFNHRQLGKTDEWLNEQLIRTGVTGDKANADFFNIWPSGSAASPIDLDVLRRIKEGITPELYTSVSPVSGYLLRWWVAEDELEYYMANNKTIIGMDTSDGVGKDSLSFVLTDATTGALVAACAVNTDNLITYAKWLVWFMLNYPNSILVPERRNQAATIIDFLILELSEKGVDPFMRIFNWVVNDPVEFKSLYEMVMVPLNRRDPDIYIRAKSHFGFATSGSGKSSRTELYSSVLMSATRRFGHLVRDNMTAQQMLSLTVRNNRIDHPKGGHDDMVIGWLMGHWFLSRASNLKHYGIDSSKILIDQSVLQRQALPQTYQDIIQSQIRRRIEELVELMTQNLEETLYTRHEQELKHLDKQIVLGENEFFSLDRALEHVKSERDKKRKTTQNTSINTAFSNATYHNAGSDRLYIE